MEMSSNSKSVRQKSDLWLPVTVGGKKKVSALCLGRGTFWGKGHILKLAEVMTVQRNTVTKIIKSHT